MYIAWSYPAEAGRNPAELDNRFSTMTEVRRVAWPAYEEPRWSDPLQFQQGVAGALELFFWAFAPFQQFVGEVTGEAVPVFQRIDQAGFKLPLDDRVLNAYWQTLILCWCLGWTTMLPARKQRLRRLNQCDAFSNAKERA
jgi:hypothetical protein